MVKKLRSLEDTKAVAEALAPMLRAGDLLLLTGVIGAGKTTFIQFLAKAMGVTEAVTSPSFVLHTIYETGRIPLSHVDIYRLDTEEEVETCGFEEFYDEAVTVVEWADRYSQFPPPYLKLDFLCAEDENERTLTVTPCGGDWEERMEAIKW